MTVVVVLFLYIVRYVADGHYRPRFVSKAKPKRIKLKLPLRTKASKKDVSNDLIFEQQ